MVIIKLDSIITIDSSLVFKKYDFNQDTLLLDEIWWAEDTNDKITDSSNLKIYFETEFSGSLKKCTRKEKYSYTRNVEGKLLRNTKIYEVKNDKWVLIK